ncbi:MAG: hypothetical protein GY765_38325 [bacterium]|nr:hypothetical protein [bacterium]
MIEKEFKDILKPTAMRLSFVAVVPLLAIFKVPVIGPLNWFLRVLGISRGLVSDNPYIVILVFLAGLSVLMTANYCGTKAFHFEHTDKAFEYLFSMPLSKGQIFMKKAGPRLAVLGVLTILYELVAFAYFAPLRPTQGNLFFLFDPVFFPVWVLFIFFTGFFMGVFEQKNWLPIVTLCVLTSVVLVSLGAGTLLSGGGVGPLYLNGLSAVFGALAISLILALAFIPVFSKMDVKSHGLFARKFSLLVLPFLFLVSVLGIMLI